MVLIACIPVVVALLSRYVFRGKIQEVVVDMLLLVGFFVSLVLGFTFAYVICKLLVITCLIGLFIKWIQELGVALISILMVVLIGFAWL